MNTKVRLYFNILTFLLFFGMLIYTFMPAIYIMNHDVFKTITEKPVEELLGLNNETSLVWIWFRFLGAFFIFIIVILTWTIIGCYLYAILTIYKVSIIKKFLTDDEFILLTSTYSKNRVFFSHKYLKTKLEKMIER